MSLLFLPRHKDIYSRGASSNTNISTISSAGEVLGLLAGTDTIMYTVANPGCSAVAMHSGTVLPYAVCALGASPPAPLRGREEVLRVWPNPNDGTFSVLVVSANDEEMEVAVSDVTERLMRTFTGETNMPAIVTLKVHAGVYFLSAKTDSATFNGKVEVRQVIG